MATVRVQADDFDVSAEIAALRARGAKRGVASLCIGGGEATAMGIELI